ncbi:ABC transporter permease [Rummeliibacillus suwonensis]|jgi:ABC-type transport system involved in multi-copper enzyme maturation permease subunit|uniref:ABC transporter permease n=1 Tax=Rummeliibacillus suwonensis TaxID=1306154 RepID=UPI0011B3B47A|nr:ABC transporter permease [Rummeliibacillus suwonensis]MBO2534395.1 ABC transporter permease [Rummeliibacillus suwonensis]
MKSTFKNPVLIKELKLRFRSFKSFAGILFYLLVLSVFVFGFIFISTNFTGNGFINPEQSVLLFGMLTYVQLALILFITPGLTAGAISTEREKQTLNILLTSSQSSFQIIFGKMSSSIIFLLLLLIAGLPLYSLVFLFGGISPGQLLIIFAFLIVTMLAIASIGVMFSTLIRKTILSMISTYGAMLFLTGITAFFFVIGISTMGNSSLPNHDPAPFSHFWAMINPIALMLTLITPEMSDSLFEITKIHFPVWAGYLIFYMAITIICLLISVKKLRVNMRKKK